MSVISVSRKSASGVSGHLGAGSRQKHKRMTIGEFAIIAYLVARDAPQISTMNGVFVVPEKIAHTMIDNFVRARVALQDAKTVGMDQPRGSKQLLRFGFKRRAIKAQQGETRCCLNAARKEIELGFALMFQPCTMRVVVQPKANCVFGARRSLL